jgi:hypothetical protein
MTDESPNWGGQQYRLIREAVYVQTAYQSLASMHQQERDKQNESRSNN